MAQHKYKVGQYVTLADVSGKRASGDVEITRLMPAAREDLEPQYRVKSRSEAHERVVQEGQIAGG